MAWPSNSARTKNWGSEVLTDADLEAQFDILHQYFIDSMNATTGHQHSGGTNDGPKINLTSAVGVTGILPLANGGTGVASGFLVGNPVGSIVMWPTTTAPTDYLICDGTAVSRTTYATLFTVLGTSFGTGDGSTTFNLPNFKGSVPVGYDASQTEFDAMGETGGAKTHTLSTSEIPSHSHNCNTYKSGDQDVFLGQGVQSFGFNRSIATESAGGGGSHNNLQPYLTINYAIRYQ